MPVQIYFKPTDDDTQQAVSPDNPFPVSLPELETDSGQPGQKRLVTVARTRMLEAHFAAGGTLTEMLDVGSGILAGILIGGTWTTANITLQGTPEADASKLQNMYDDTGTEISITAAASRAIGLDTVAGALAPWPYLRIRSGTSALPVAQTAAVTIYLVVKG